MADAGARMDAHLCPEDGASCWRDTPWWRMRAFETQADMLFSAVQTTLRALLRRMLDQGLQSDALLCEKLAALLRDGREAEARALAEQADESALVAAPAKRSKITPAPTLRPCGSSLPTRLAACPQADERVRAVFHTQRTPVENAMTLGVVHTNTKLTFAPLHPRLAAKHRRRRIRRRV